MCMLGGKKKEVVESNRRKRGAKGNENFRTIKNKLAVESLTIELEKGEAEAIIESKLIQRLTEVNFSQR